MGIEQVRAHLRKWNREQDILEYPVSSATVPLAASALSVEEGRIAKTLSFRGSSGPVLIVVAGDVRIDNHKYKAVFGCKARMLSAEEAREQVGHEIGGICPFGVRPGVMVYLDRSLQRFATVFPACGSANSAIELNCTELEQIAGAHGWVEVSRYEG